MKNKLLISLILILAGVLLRLGPHIPNATPVAAIALLASAYLSWKHSLFVVTSIMIITDSVLGFHSTMLWVYASFGLIAMLAWLLRKNINIKNVVFFSLSGSLLFFLITNFGVWISTSMYDKTLPGLVECYTLAIPFFRNTILGDVFYSLLLFGLYQLYTSSKSSEPLQLAAKN